MRKMKREIQKNAFQIRAGRFAAAITSTKRSEVKHESSASIDDWKRRHPLKRCTFQHQLAMFEVVRHDRHYYARQRTGGMDCAVKWMYGHVNDQL
ncbi:hypothetical protein M514_20029, partial [Trichuris suis]